MKVRSDYVKQLRTKTRLERLVNSNLGFVLFIVFIILAGAEI